MRMFQIWTVLDIPTSSEAKLRALLAGLCSPCSERERLLSVEAVSDDSLIPTLASQMCSLEAEAPKGAGARAFGFPVQYMDAELLVNGEPAESTGIVGTRMGDDSWEHYLVHVGNDLSKLHGSGGISIQAIEISQVDANAESFLAALGISSEQVRERYGVIFRHKNVHVILTHSTDTEDCEVQVVTFARDTHIKEGTAAVSALVRVIERILVTNS